MTYKTTSTGPDATSGLGEALGRRLPDGSVLELRSDLGGGKTTFVQGVARGLGYLGDVASPTFTLSRVYDLPDGRRLHHFDLYRLAGTDVVVEELADIAGSDGNVVAVEWPSVAESVLPEGRLIVGFAVTGEDSREITFTTADADLARIVTEVTT